MGSDYISSVCPLPRCFSIFTFIIIQFIYFICFSL